MRLAGCENDQAVWAARAATEAVVATLFHPPQDFPSHVLLRGGGLDYCTGDSQGMRDRRVGDYLIGSEVTKFISSILLFFFSFFLSLREKGRDFWGPPANLSPLARFPSLHCEEDFISDGGGSSHHAECDLHSSELGGWRETTLCEN